MDHVLLTRFNLPSPGAESVVRARHGWLVERVGLFERFCLPSVLAQSNRDAKWIIYFDPESPLWLKDKVSEHAEAGYYVPVYRASVDRAELRSDIAAQFDRPGDELLTTNLDNDDAIASDFVERLWAQPRPATSTVYYLVNGLVRSSTGVYHHYDRHNAFVSMRSAWPDPVTCWADWHTRLNKAYPVVEVGGAPAWLQVVHGGNVTNRTRGKLVSPAGFGPLFGDLLDDVTQPNRAALIEDRLVRRPLRVTRDSSRSVIKNVAMKVLGPNGFERAKHIVAARVGR